MAIAIGTPSFIQVRVEYTDTQGERKKIEFEIDPATTAPNLLAIASGFDTFSNADVQIELVQVTNVTGLKGAPVNAIEHLVSIAEDLVFAANFAEVGSRGVAQKSISLAAPIEAVYGALGKTAVPPPAGFAAWVAALGAALVRPRKVLDPVANTTSTIYSTGFSFAGGQLVAVSDIIEGA